MTKKEWKAAMMTCVVTLLIQVNWFVLLLNKSTGATITITWPSEVDWPGGTAPAVPGTNEQDAYAFFTINGGTTWYGFHVGDNLQ